MKPYYQDEWVKIYHGDCREILPTLEKVDLVLTDFPYGNNTAYGVYDDTEDNLILLIRDTMPLIIGGASRALITCGVANIGLYPKPEWILSWITPAGSGSGKGGFCCWQPILAYGKDPYLQAGKGRRPDIFIKTELSADSEHPCSKPIDIWRMILLRGSISTDDIILDPFLGSGTTLRACLDTNRKCIGIEIEEKYCEIAAKRCSQSVMRFDI